MRCRGQDIAGQSIGSPTRFHIGVAVNPFAPDAYAEWRRLDHKVQAGAEFILTPPILDLDAFDAVLERLRQTGLPILAAVVALDSLRQAEFIASEVTGARVPDAVLDRLRRASDPAAEAARISLEVAKALVARADGLQVTSVHGSTIAAEQLLAALTGGVAARPQVVRRG